MTKNQREEFKTSLSMKRTILSIKQTKMAASRTLLSYISTGCVFLSLALAYIKVQDNKFDVFTIIMFVVASMFLIIGLVDFILVRKSLKDILKDGVAETRQEQELIGKE